MPRDRSSSPCQARWKDSDDLRCNDCIGWMPGCSGRSASRKPRRGTLLDAYRYHVQCYYRHGAVTFPFRTYMTDPAAGGHERAWLINGAPGGRAVTDHTLPRAPHSTSLPRWDIFDKLHGRQADRTQRAAYDLHSMGPRAYMTCTRYRVWWCVVCGVPRVYISLGRSK